MVNMISALVKRPGELPRHVNVSNSLEALQKNVEGYIETVTARAGGETFVIICNEEGRLLGKPFNTVCAGYSFLGPILIVGVTENEEGEQEFADLPVDWKTMKQLFPELWDPMVCRR